MHLRMSPSCRPSLHVDKSSAAQLADQLPLQRPPLLVRQIGDSDLQHYSSLGFSSEPPTSEAGPPTTFLCSLHAVEKPNGTEHSNQVYLLAPTAFRAQISGAKFREGTDRETEIWRACQRSSTAGEGVKLHLAAEWRWPLPGCILLITKSRRALFSSTSAETGVKCRRIRAAWQR